MRCPTPISVPDPDNTSPAIRITVPCGKCGACRHNRRADWSFRLQQELKTAINAYFLTLTYSDDNLPVTEDGEVTLRKRDLQLFIKRIRKASKKEWPDEKFRYYAVGEYGSETGRPHYHILCYNTYPLCVNADLCPWYYGHIKVGTVTPQSIHYVAKYHVNVGEIDGTREPEFATMSRRPGIGALYVSRAFKWHRENDNYFVVNNGYRQRVPRYYIERLFTKIERRIRSMKNVEEGDQAYWREYDRLIKLAIDDPDRYMFKSQLQDAQRIKDKGSDGNVF